MDNAKTLDVQLTTVLEDLQRLGGNNEQQPSLEPDLEKYVHEEICALMDAKAPIRDTLMKYIAWKLLRLRFRCAFQWKCSGRCHDGEMFPAKGRLEGNRDGYHEKHSNYSPRYQTSG